MSFFGCLPCFNHKRVGNRHASGDPSSTSAAPAPHGDPADPSSSTSAALDPHDAPTDPSSSASAAPVPHGAPTDPSSSASIPPIPSPVGCEYEVFLSFRGLDTRTTFTDFLYHDLLSAGIRTFRDDEDLRKGEEIGPELLTAIKQSKISIPVLSKGYAESKWCLKEAVQMVDCMETTKQMILPVFYDVRPHQVRHQTEDYGLAFSTHEKNHSPEVVTQWKDALSEIGKLKGWDLTDPSNRYQGKVVKEIVSEVWKQLNRSKLNNPSHLVGIDDHVDEIMDMLDIKIPDVRIVGIWGMSGVGKTTLAKFVYSQVMDHFEHCCFLSNIRERSSQSGGLGSLQGELFSDILRYKHENFDNVDKGKGILGDRIPREKVLIVLDDVDQPEQPSNLLPGLYRYAPGSRIIVTTWNRDVLNEFPGGLFYEVKEMNQEDALVLFCKHAFGQDFPDPKNADLSREIARATGGLPLALEVIGSHLFSVSQEDVWHEALEWLKQEKTIQNRLRISYNALDDNERQIFLDVACFPTGMDYKALIQMWKASKFLPASAIQKLCTRSLIKIENNKEVWMHDQLKYLGREIVRQENRAPGERSRLWCHEEAIEVLQREEGTPKVEAINLDHGLEEVEKRLEGQKFAKLTRLRFLELGDSNLGENFDRCLRGLKWLSWHGNTTLNIPSDLHPKDLTILDLSNSAVTMNWIGWSSDQVLKKLEVVNLTSCHSLTESPHFTSFLPIKKLILEDCKALIMVHQSIRHLTTLESLILKNCCRLEMLPEELGTLSSLVELVVDGTLIQEIPMPAGMPSLKTLSAQRCKLLTQIPKEFPKLQKLLLNHCVSLGKIPSSVGCWEPLEELNLSHTSVTCLPNSVEDLINLKVLDISHSSVGNFPRSLEKLQKLEVVNASYCKRLAGMIPFGLTGRASLRILRLDHTSVAQVPSGIRELGDLQTLNLKSCIHLETLPDLPISLVNLKVTCRFPETKPLNLPYLINLKQLEILECSSIITIPANISDFPHLKELSIGDCPKLQYLPGLPSSLRRLQLSGLSSLERLPNLSNLKSLQRFYLLKCRWVKEIPGLKEIVSLKTLRTSSPVCKLNGLECLSSLTCLWVEDCLIKNQISNLSNLQKLRELKLEDCKYLVDIQGIEELVCLEVLHLSKCDAINEIPDLSNLQKLRELKLEECEDLVDIQRIEQLVSLEVLHLSQCGAINWIANPSNLQKLREMRLEECRYLVDIQGVEELVCLEVLHLSKCDAINEIPDLYYLQKLRELKLEKCEDLVDIQGIEQLVSLEVLHVSQCGEINWIVDLSNLQKLRELKVKHCPHLTNIQGIEELVCLEVLHLSSCEALNELLDLSNLQKLRKLKLKYCLNLAEIRGLGESVFLEVLHLSRCDAINKIYSLSNRHKLRELKLNECRHLEYIQGIEELVCLEVLHVSSWEALNELPDLSHLQKLRILKINYCPHLAKIRGLGELVYLESLDLSFCEAIMEIPDLSKLHKLRNLNLAGCIHLAGIQGLGELTCLAVLDLSDCEAIEEIPDLSMLRRLVILKVPKRHQQVPVRWRGR